MTRLWVRLRTHALLRESRIFPDVELCDELLDSMPYGFTDMWRGNYHGELVCIKAIRAQDPAHLKEIKSVCGSFLLPEVHSARLISDLPL